MHFTTIASILVLSLTALAAPAPARPSALETRDLETRAVSISKRHYRGFRHKEGHLDIERVKRHLLWVLRRTKMRLAIRKGRGIKKRDDGEGDGSGSGSGNSTTPGSVPLMDEDGTLWSGEITVGTPPVTYRVDFDTGSSDLFLPGPDCQTNCDGHTVYDPSKSSTSAPLTTPFSLQYGDGSAVNGTEYTDTVTIAGFAAQNQTLGAASVYSDGFSKQNFGPDGLMGMAFQSISVYNAPPVFQSLVANGAVKTPSFSFKLAQNGSELFIGGTNSALFTGDFSFAPVVEQGYWQVNMDSATVGGKKVLDKTLSIIDTGTTLVVGDKASVKKVYDAIPGSKDASASVGDGFFTFPCNKAPSVSLSFGGKSWAMSSDTFNLGPASSGSSDCVGSIVSGDTSGSGWIVGDAFLQNVYTQFDYGQTRVGFAALKA